ncbi:GNAT family protein [Spirillospora sp. NPDC052269]
MCLSGDVLTALSEGNLAAASSAAGLAFTGHFATESAIWLWRYRLDQLTADPQAAPWLVHAVVAEPENVVVGHAGFHGPPDHVGMVEIGYSVVPAHRRQGYARAILSELLRRADAEPAVRIVRATISPDNAASLATIAGHGFTEVGEQQDPRDGLEIIFERPANG